MKTQEKILLEMGADRIHCFYGHTESYKKFEKCCLKFMKSEWGLSRCMLRTIENRLLPERVAGIRAALEIASSKISPVLLDSAFRFRKEIDAKLGNFCNPRRMIRFETQDEIRKAVLGMQIPDPEIPEETIAEVDGLYDSFCLLPMAVEESNGKVTVVLGPEDDEQYRYLSSLPALGYFLQELTGERDLKVRGMKNPKSIKVRVRGMEGLVKLGTLVSCGLSFRKKS